MLTELFPRAHRRYLSLPVLGSMMEGFAAWLFEQGYRGGSLRRHVKAAGRLDRALQQQGRRSLSELTRGDLRACAAEHSRNDPETAATARALHRYLEDRGALATPASLGPMQSKLTQYGDFLEQVRGLSPATISNHCGTIAQFLDHLGYETHPSCLAKLTMTDLEEFVRVSGRRLSRATLQHTVARLRSFLRFLAGLGEISPGLHGQIDTPRVYRGERLPRALPWETVRALLDSIDRSTPIGRRDYAIFLLIATYGVRAGEIVALTLDHVEWRVGRIRVAQRKTATPLLLPLTDAVGEALLDYLRQGRPALPCRTIFLRHRAPAGVLKPTAVTEAFQAWSRRSGLAIPFQGPHCLRHSYAVHLLRQGVSLKTIGDVLGHRSAESTCVYLRLAIDDLRDAALPLPQEWISGAAEGGRS